MYIYEYMIFIQKIINNFFEPLPFFSFVLSNDKVFKQSFEQSANIE